MQKFQRDFAFCRIDFICLGLYQWMDITLVEY